MFKLSHPAPIFLAIAGSVTVVLAGTGQIPGLFWLVGVALILLSIWVRSRHEDRAEHLAEH